MAVQWNNLPNEVVGKFLIQGLECYKGTQIKAYHKYDKYVEYWRELEIWVRWSCMVMRNDAYR